MHSTDAVQQRPRQIRQTTPLLASLIEIVRGQPRFERALQGRPFFVDRGIPRGVAIASLVDERLTEHALERKAEPLRRDARGAIEGIALPFIAAITELE